jgi:hypothetical protein
MSGCGGGGGGGGGCGGGGGDGGGRGGGGQGGGGRGSGGGGRGRHDGGGGDGGGHGGGGGGGFGGRDCHRGHGLCGHGTESTIGSTKSNAVFSDPRSEVKIHGDDYLTEDKLQDQITATFLALNRHLVPDHTAAMERPDIHHYVVPILVCAVTVLLFVHLPIQRG